MSWGAGEHNFDLGWMWYHHLNCIWHRHNDINLEEGFKKIIWMIPTPRPTPPVTLSGPFTISEAWDENLLEKFKSLGVSKIRNLCVSSGQNEGRSTTHKTNKFNILKWMPPIFLNAHRLGILNTSIVAFYNNISIQVTFFYSSIWTIKWAGKWREEFGGFHHPCLWSFCPECDLQRCKFITACCWQSTTSVVDTGAGTGSAKHRRVRTDKLSHCGPAKERSTKPLQ